MNKHQYQYAGINIEELPIITKNDAMELRPLKNAMPDEHLKNVVQSMEDTINTFAERNHKIKNDRTLTPEARVIKTHKEAGEMRQQLMGTISSITTSLSSQGNKIKAELFSSKNAELSVAEASLLPNFVEALQQSEQNVADFASNPSQAKVLIHLQKTAPSLLPEKFREMDIYAVDKLHNPDEVEQIKHLNDLMQEIENRGTELYSQFSAVAPDRVVEAIKEFVSN